MDEDRAFNGAPEEGGTPDSSFGGITQDKDGKICGMDADKFLRGYAELLSEEEYSKEYGFSPTDDYTDTPGMNFLLELVGPVIRREKDLPKIANPQAVKTAASMIRDLKKIFAGTNTTVDLNTEAGVRSWAKVMLSGNKVVVEKDMIQGFLSVIKRSHDVDIEAHIDGDVVITMWITDYWKVVDADGV